MEWGFGNVGICGSGLVLPALLPVFSEGSFPWEEAWEGLPQLHGMSRDLFCPLVDKSAGKGAAPSSLWEPPGNPGGKRSSGNFFPDGTAGNCGVWPKDPSLDPVGSEQGFWECCWDWADPQTWLFSGKNLSFLIPLSTSKGSLEFWSITAASCPWE